MARQIDRRNVKICLDVPLFAERQSNEYVQEAVDKCGDLIVYSHYGAWNFAETAAGEAIQTPAPGHGGLINYTAFLSALKRRGYDGYLASEYCIPMIRDHKPAGIEEVDKSTVTAMRYIKKLIAEA